MNFSVVIAAFNCSSTITAAIESCLAQSYPPFEIIVVDDASTDNTSVLLQDFAEPIKLIQHKKNEGVSSARNTGWNAALGDFVAFLDSDDLWHPEKLFYLNQYLSSHPRTLFLAHPFTTKQNTTTSILDPMPITKLSFGRLLWRNQIQGSCIIVNKHLPQRFDVSMRYSEDYDLALRCAYEQTLIFICLPLSIRTNPQKSMGSLSDHKWSMRKGELYLFSKIGRLNLLLIPLIPILWLYSLAKHLFQTIK